MSPVLPHSRRRVGGVAPALAARLPELPDRLAGIADRRRIAVVPLKGVIGGTLKAPEVTRRLDAVRRDRRLCAVLLDIDSPGGSAVESEAMYLAVKRLAAAKPVVAWIRGTGASGSYFLACGATRLLAFPSAVVGSIGVISARPILVDALRRLGATVAVTKTGPMKDLGAPWREPTDADRAKEQSLVDAIFRRFTGAVGAARDLEGEALARVSTGEVWLAEEAVGLGLIDGVCEEEAALEEAQRLAGLPHHRTRRVESRRGVARRLGLPFAALGSDGEAWLAELEGWLSAPRLRL